jgi:hypothetical protein
VPDSVPEVVASASRLRAAIEETAAALAGADLDRLLASDALLQKTLNDIPTAVPPTPGGRADLRREVEEARAALQRCRRLGAALNDYIRLTLDAQGRGLGYEPARAAAAALTGRGFTERA